MLNEVITVYAIADDLLKAIGGVLIAIGSPANPPKPRGKSPGWEKGKLRQRKNPCPFVKKRTYKPRKSKAQTDNNTEVIVV